MSTSPAELTIVPLARLHARAVAELHISGIHAGFISSLGPAFVTALYEGISDDSESFGFVALSGGKVVGFVALTADVRHLYRTIVRRHAFSLSLLLFRKLFSVQAFKRILETLFYPRRLENLRLPKAEILSIAVAPEARASGLGVEFIRLALDAFHQRGIREVKMLAAEPLPVNRMYRLMGFPVRTKVVNHGIPSNIYVVPTDFFHRRQAMR